MPSSALSLSNNPESYTGRFAPSPTGPLHFGSLLTAIASYLDARARKGRWLVRMEDIDPPREPVGAASEILRQLEQFNLLWDGAVLYQSTRLDAYSDVLSHLSKANLCYACTCTRSDIRAMKGIYDGHCRELDHCSDQCSVRLRTTPAEIAFNDVVQGGIRAQIATQVGDFIIRRKDGLFAYQLAVVVDDEYQGITDVVRGYDLLESTPRQIYLQNQLEYKTPRYAHIPVITDNNGEKLSKQRFAAPIMASHSLSLTHRALQILEQAPPPLSEFSNNAEMLEWAIKHWDIQAVPKLANITPANLQ